MSRALGHRPASSLNSLGFSNTSRMKDKELAKTQQQADLLRMLDDFTSQLNSLHHIGRISWGIDPEEISMQIAKIRASLPQDLKTAAATVRESERIIAAAHEDAKLRQEKAASESTRIVEDAKKEAERLVEQAKLTQEQLLSESELLRLTKLQSDDLRTKAERDAIEMKRGAEKYAYDVLAQLENVVGRAMQTIERGKSDLAKTEAASNAPQTKERKG
jgi:hypothetical protein